VRVLPSILVYNEKFGKVPANLTFAFACLIRFYKGTWNGAGLPVDDSKEITDAFGAIWADGTAKAVQQTLQNTEFWGEDLTAVKGLSETLELAINEINANGIEEGYQNYLKSFESIMVK
jgi:tagaturonate reductase